MENTQASKGPGVDVLLENLKDSQLLTAEEIDRAVQQAGSAAANGLALARALVAAGVLTSYQMEAVCNRSFAALRIGNYDVLNRLGAGGMGTVLKARHRRMKRIVALKVLAQDLARDESFVKRFQREVEMIARFQHANIVMAYDADEAEAGPFLVMEFVDGRDLASTVESDGPLSFAAALSCILQAARGLEYAHKQGIIHRDIKPANLLRDAGGVVKVTDLGLARLSGRANGGSGAPGAITQAGGILGTVDYMSPEQAIDSTAIDLRADIYSLGATLYFLLVGQPPYLGQTMMATLWKHREAPIPSLMEARKDVPAALDALFRRMMAKSPADRFQTMTEVVQALEAIEASPDFKAQTSGRPAAGQAPSFQVPSPPRQAPQQGLSTSPGTLAQTVQFKAGAAVPVTLPLKVLLVEPSRTQSGIIRKYLQGQGVQDVVAVASGQEALQAVRSRAPDVIVSALHLADMTGVQLAQQIKAEAVAASPGFVLISSEAESAQVGSLSKCGKAVLLQKPFTPQQLLDALKMVSGGPGPAVQRAARTGLRVLIVDDSAPARLHVRGTLQGLGLTDFAEAADGAQAVAAVAREPFDLIVTDYNMPLMDGRGLIGYLKQNPATASVPIILVTTEQDQAKLAAVRELGVTAICDKSFPAAYVARIIDQLVKRP
jgi:serine/threonine protein kinase/DNA-binding response OmpR family regulator